MYLPTLFAMGNVPVFTDRAVELDLNILDGNSDPDSILPRFLIYAGSIRVCSFFNFIIEL